MASRCTRCPPARFTRRAWTGRLDEIARDGGTVGAHLDHPIDQGVLLTLEPVIGDGLDQDKAPHHSPPLRYPRRQRVQRKEPLRPIHNTPNSQHTANAMCHPKG